MDSSTSTAENSENLSLFVFISPFLFFGACIYEQYFFWCSGKSNFKQKKFNIIGQKKIVKRHVNMLYTLTNGKH